MKHCYKTQFDILALISSTVIAVILRIAIPFNIVFQNGKVIFNSVDAYYQLRFADLIKAHYPQVSFFDPYLGSTTTRATPLFNYLLVWFGNIFGNMDMVAAYLPAILGILTIIPVYIITKSIFSNKWVTSLSVFFIAILSGLFFNRTQLGATDYHCLEIFLLTTMMMWIVLALKEKWIWLRLSYIGLAICTFGLYWFTWKGCLVAIGILAVFLYIWFSMTWLNKRAGVKRSFILHSFVLAFIAGIMVYSYTGRSEPNQFQSLVIYGVDIIRWRTTLVALEELPLLFLGQASGSGVLLDLRTVWGYFGFLFFFALVGLGMLIYRVQKHRQPIELLLLVWTVVMLLLTLAMRRWAYYLAINIAILSSYSCFIIGQSLIIKKRILIKDN